MGGGLMQLVAYGAQDIYLTGNPQITFFKVVYRRHTNFSMESIQQTFNGSADFGKRVTCTVSRNGDLVHRMYLQVTLPALTGTDFLPAIPGSASGVTPVVAPVPAVVASGWCDYVGHALIKNVEIEIGGQRIDKQYGEWMHIWNELTQCAGKKLGYNTMIGGALKGAVIPQTSLYIPLQFWFNRNPGLALPLIALQYHEVKLNFEFNDKGNCVDPNILPALVPSLQDATLYVDYIYLDTDERRRFAQVSHEYLIEQLQFTGDESVSGGSNKFKLNFNHPCKELVWVNRAVESENARKWFNFSNTAGIRALKNPVTTAKLQLNGHDRFSEREGVYFNYVQPYQHHENIPAEGINVYSFALKPEEHQPSGSCNFSRIDNATLQVQVNNFFSAFPGVAKIFAVNYNVLRIMSGMGGLAYSN